MRSLDDVRAFVRAAQMRVVFRRCTHVEAGAMAFGDVFVWNLGSIDIGRGFSVSGVPVRSHLTTGPLGTLAIGERVRIAHGASISAHGEILIGDDTTIGPMAMIMDIDFHELKNRSRPGAPRRIRIGRRVRIGSGVVILRGAVIGDGARIAPNSVVSRAIPAGACAAGVPARPLP